MPRPWTPPAPAGMSTPDALMWAVRLLAVSARHPMDAAGWNAASEEMDRLLSPMPVEDVGQVAQALALLPRITAKAWLSRSELDRLKAIVAWTWSDG
jgi:hypothetical protein